ncbi:hypothetical protein [Algoriphagus aquimarinus]|nr:hypothetical protein [Algoriphagus aquimarinus]
MLNSKSQLSFCLETAANPKVMVSKSGLNKDVISNLKEQRQIWRIASL